MGQKGSKRSRRSSPVAAAADEENPAASPLPPPQGQSPPAEADRPPVIKAPGVEPVDEGGGPAEEPPKRASPTRVRFSHRGERPPMSPEVAAARMRNAAVEGNVSELVDLLEKGADVNGRDGNQRTPIHWAAQHGRVEAVELLAKEGADLNAAGPDHCTPLLAATHNGDVEVMRKLLNAGARPDVRDRNKRTALLLAAWKGFVEPMELLLSKGADVNARSRNLRTPLHWVAQQGRVDAMSMLLERGADVFACSQNRCTPLHYAAEHGRVRAVRLLLNHSADTEAIDGAGHTSLHEAARVGSWKSVRALLSRGASMEGCEVVSMCLSSSFPPLLQWLFDGEVPLEEPKRVCPKAVAEDGEASAEATQRSPSIPAAAEPSRSRRESEESIEPKILSPAPVQRSPEPPRAADPTDHRPAVRCSRVAGAPVPVVHRVSAPLVDPASTKLVAEAAAELEEIKKKRMARIEARVRELSAVPSSTRERSTSPSASPPPEDAQVEQEEIDMAKEDILDSPSPSPKVEPAKTEEMIMAERLRWLEVQEMAHHGAAVHRVHMSELEQKRNSPQPPKKVCSPAVAVQADTLPATAVSPLITGRMVTERARRVSEVGVGTRMGASAEELIERMREVVRELGGDHDLPLPADVLHRRPSSRGSESGSVTPSEELSEEEPNLPFLCEHGLIACSPTSPEDWWCELARQLLRCLFCGVGDVGRRRGPVPHDYDPDLQWPACPYPLPASISVPMHAGLPPPPASGVSLTSSPLRLVSPAGLPVVSP